MCDTYVSLSESSKDKNVIFGKNSDRNPSEVQLITFKARINYSKGANVKCTHISIPQVQKMNLLRKFLKLTTKLDKNLKG
jgi:hypothetical protein